MTRDSEIPLAILISGGGSTMQRIIQESQKGGRLEGKIKPAVVISSRPNAAGIQKATDLGIPTVTIQRKDFEKGDTGKTAFGDAIIIALKQHGAVMFSQNGWLPLTPENVASTFYGYNQHLAPLDPDHLGNDGTPLHFGGKGMHGLAAHSAVLEFQRLVGRSFPTEATIHKVSPQIDGGAVVYQRPVDVLLADTPELLAARVLPVEHEGQIQFWQEVFNGNVVEVHRPTELIRDAEEPFLRQAILYARQQYPNG